MYHNVGKNKALVFERVLGYNSGNANHLIKQVYEKYLDGEMTLGTLDDFRQRHTIDIDMTGPNGENAVVHTDWIFNQETWMLRLTTIYVK